MRALAACLLVIGCKDAPREGVVPKAIDAQVRLADAASDALPVDAASDAASDALPVDAANDAGIDATSDVLPVDAGIDAANDALPVDAAPSAKKKKRAKSSRAACLDECRKRNQSRHCMSDEGMVDCPCHCP